MTSQDRWQSHKVCLVMGAGRILCARFWTLKKDNSQFRACRKHRRAFCVPLDASCKKPFRLEAMYSTDPKVGTHLYGNLSYQFSSVQSISRVWLSLIPWIAAHQASLSITNSWSSPRLMSIESVMPSSHLILGRPVLLLPPIPPSISLFQWVNSSHEVAKVLEFQL